MNRFQLGLIILALFGVLMSNCNSSATKPKKTESSARIKSKVKITSPKNGLKLATGTSFKLELSSKGESVSIDSVLVSFGNSSIKGRGSSLEVDTKSALLGRHSIYAKAYLSDGTMETKRSNITILSDAAPKTYTYRVVNRYPHDPKAFTQGLTIHKGALYESTGQHGASVFRKVDLSTGKPLKEVGLEQRYFGEGSTIVDNKIYYITWTSRQGFIYDLDSFEALGSFNYSTEGWGLTASNDTLIMSDGSEVIYFKEKDSFNDIASIQVYDNQRKIDQLNELEYFNGKIYANRWMTDLIYIINPKNGQAEGVINLAGLLTEEERRQYSVDVLNGIAYDGQTNKLYVTGKNWPTLFEIELVERSSSNQL